MARNASAAPRKAANGTWWFNIDIGIGPDGQRRRAHRRGFPTKKAAQEELDRLRHSVATASYVAPRQQTLSDYLTNDWLPAAKLNLEQSTWASYRRYLDPYVIPRIGSIRLQSLDAGTLNRLYAELLEGGRRDGKPGGLSPRTVRYISTILHRALREAVEWGRLVRNPAEYARPPRARDAKAPPMKTWTADELEEFLRRSAENRYQPAWTFLATTGCRRGEAVGLCWQDVNLDTARVSIRQAITAIDHHIKIGSQTKTAKARVIELDARTVSALKTWRATQAQERLAMGAGYNDLGLVFCHPDGQPYHPERFSREFDRMIERLGLRRIRLHDLRHTWATLALQAGVPTKVVSERLGHATTAVTSDIYSHVAPGMQTDAAERVAALIFAPRLPRS
jgi:integrase